MIIFLLIFIILLRSCFYNNSNEPITVPDDSSFSEQSNQKDDEVNTLNLPSMISIPGYEAITLRADSKRQEISFNNPEKNNCYFIVSLYLSDGTFLWKSDYVGPGEISEAVVLSQELSAGIYTECTLKYECFTYDSLKKQLNGAETKITLFIK